MDITKIFKDKEKAYIYMERYVNNGSPSGFSKNTTSESTQPFNGNKTFPVKIIKFDDEIQVKEIGSTECYLLPDKSIFCHPDNIEHPILQKNKQHWEIVGEIEVSPTASGRTVKCVGENNFFIKLDYIGILGRIPRNLDLKRIQSAFEVTNIIKNAIKAGKMNTKFALLLEDYGRAAYLPTEEGKVYELGFVLRNDRIYSANEQVKDLALIPTFSLFGNDLNEPNSKSILVQLFEKQDKPINKYAFEDILKPIIDCYFDTLINCGLCIEAHAQNMLVAIDSNYQIQYIVARDMESVDKDLPLRKFLGLPDDEIVAQNYKCLRESDYNYQIMHSFMYDFKLGGYLLDPIIELFKNTYDEFDEELIVSQIKLLAQSYIAKLPLDYFSECWYDYANVIHEQGKKRPYVAHANPRYR